MWTELKGLSMNENRFFIVFHFSTIFLIGGGVLYWNTGVSFKIILFVSPKNKWYHRYLPWKTWRE